MSNGACKHMELAARTREWGRTPNECQNGEKYWCERRICCEAVIEDGEEGLLVPSGDATALAAALRRLIESPDQRRAMGAAGRKRATKDLDIKQVVARTLVIYGELQAAIGDN